MNKLVLAAALLSFGTLAGTVAGKTQSYSYGTKPAEVTYEWVKLPFAGVRYVEIDEDEVVEWLMEMQEDGYEPAGMPVLGSKILMRRRVNWPR